LLEASRQELLDAQPKQGLTHKLLRFALKHLWTSTTRLRIFFGASRIFRDIGFAKLLLKLGLAKLVSSRAHFALALLESSRAQLSGSAEAKIQVTQTTDQRGESVMLFKGCVGEGLFARVNHATSRVLQVNGFGVEAPTGQVCCGALHAHAGDLEGARKLARKNLQIFGSSGKPIITNAGGCGAMLVSYGHLLDDDEAYKFSARVRDVGQQLATQQKRIGANIDHGRATYDTSCHLLYGQKAGDASLKMLDSIPDLEFRSLEGAERCCGGAGIYNLLEPEMSAQVLDETTAADRSNGR
jgi:glycolate oxidase iron-sulfur subunit